MRVAEALAILRRTLPAAVGEEHAPLATAGGRILAADVLAPMALPPFDNSAVDGYALRFSNLATGASSSLPVVGRAPAGVRTEPVPEGTAVRIFTGAPLPAGADTVVMQEDVRRDGDTVIIPSGIAHGANCRKAGEDVAEGSVALRAGKRIGARDIALAAALGLATLPVRRRLRVGLFSTGDEVTPTEATLGAAGIHDANRPMLSALLVRAGALPSDLGILRDDPASVQVRIAEAAASHDLIVTSGGVSVGEEDHVRAAVGVAGELSFWRLAIKPGRPLAFGHVGGTPFVGLPGNPGAAYVTALAILVPLIRHLSGAEDEPSLPMVRSGFGLKKRPGRREYVKVCLRTGPGGVTEAILARGSALSGLSASDGLVELPEDHEEIRPGDLLPYRPHDLA